ncbi:hypothetical protein [Streptomyces avermitilis]
MTTHAVMPPAMAVPMVTTSFAVPSQRIWSAEPAQTWSDQIK